MPSLTIIIPTFNSALTIERCLKSIYTQVFQDFEVVVIDGSSSDNTIELVSKFKDQNRLITIISEKDHGTYDAMNKGIRISVGKWLYFLGSDDWLYNDKVLQDVFNLPDINSYDIVYGNVFRTGLNIFYDGMFTEKKLLQRNISHQCIFFKRAIFQHTGFYNTKYIILADWDHNLKWFYDPSIKKNYINITIANYTDHGVSGLKEDEIFQADKFMNIYRYAYKYLSNEMKFSIFKLILYSFHVRKKYMAAMRFLISFFGKNIALLLQTKAVSN